MSTPIARYFASMSIQVDKKSVLAVDNTLNRLEKKLKNFGKFTNKHLKLNFDINKFTVDKRKLGMVLGDALDQVSMKTVFEVSRFSVNQRNLQAAMMRSMRGVVAPAPRISSVAHPQQAAVSRSQASRAGANYLHAGGAAGAFMRYGAGSLPLVGGAYGVGMLNQANQEMVSANISAEAVLGSNAKVLLDRLAERSNYMGISYKDTLPQFTKFMASATPLMGVDASQQTFESFMQFGRTRGADKISMNRALTAVGQMSAKGQVMAEELKNQLGDASGFGELPQLFAEAYQIKSGGALKGADARAALMKAMEQGQVKSADVLPIVSQLMNELSKGGIEQARNSSVAQQMRAENALMGRGSLLQTFSEQGGEKGFANFWKEMTTLFKGAAPLVKALAGTFEDLTKTLQAPVYLFGELNKTLSAVSQMTGIAEKNFTNLALVGGLMMTKWGRVGIMFSTMLIVLEDIAMGVSGDGDSFTGRFIKWMEESGVVMGPFEKGLFGVSAGMLAIAAALKAISAATSLPGIPDLFDPTKDKNGKTGGSKWGKTLLMMTAALGAPALVAGVTGVGVNELLDPHISARNTVAERWNDPMSPLYQNRDLQLQAQNDIRDPSSKFYNNLPLFEQMMTQRGQQETLQKMLENQAAGITPLPGITPMSSKVDMTIKVDITAASAEDFQEKFKERLSATIQETLQQYGQKE